MLSIPVSRNWPVHQIDFKNSFMYGNLAKIVCMRQSSGYVICRLLKAIYGLNHAPRAWYLRFAVIISSLGFMTLNVTPPSLFIITALIPLTFSYTSMISFSLHLLYLLSPRSSLFSPMNFLCQTLALCFLSRFLRPIFHLGCFYLKIPLFRIFLHVLICLRVIRITLHLTKTKYLR